MELTRAQTKRKAVDEPIDVAPSARPKHSHQRTNIDDLPDELLLLTLELVKGAGPDYHALHALCLVNHRLNRLTIPVLYHFLNLDDGGLITPPLLLRTLLSAPRLAQFTKRIDSGKTDKNMSLTHIPQILEHIRHWEVPNVDRWITGAKHGQGDVFLAILLYLVPQIKTLAVFPEEKYDISAPPAYLDLLVYAGRVTPSLHGHGFKHLSYLRCDFRPIHAHHISALFRLPSLDHLMLICCEWSEQDFSKVYANTAHILSAWECPPRSSSVGRLAFSGPMPFEIVDTMISSCLSLRIFWFFGDVYLNSQPGWFRHIESALKQHQGSLERLSFDDIRFAGSPPITEQLAGQFCDISSFPLLTTYVGPLAPLLTSNHATLPNQLARLALPPSVEHVLLEVPPSWDPLSLVDLSDPTAHTVIPRLKRLYIRYHVLSLGSANFEMIVLKRYFERAGIKFCFHLDFTHFSDTNATYFDWVATLRAKGSEGVELAKRACCGLVGHGEHWEDAEGLDVFNNR